MTATPTRTDAPDHAPVAGFRLTKLFGLVWTFLCRLFRRGQRKKEGHEVTRIATPDPVRHEDLHGTHPVQRTTDGTGPLFYRHYSVSFVAPGTDTATLMARVQADPNEFSPPELAVFRKTRGAAGRMAVGDEFFIEITGPWNGPVRVIRVDPTRFSLATLEGHMEAGEIRFELNPRGKSTHYDFDIYSWARSRDVAVDLAYDKLKVAQAAQTEMWTLYCENVSKRLGEQTKEVTVETKKTEFRTEAIPAADPASSASRYAARLAALEALKLNFDVEQRDTYTPETGWSLDRHECPLPAERPGPPEVDGAFEQACRVLRNYEFPDPRLIEGIFRDRDALAERRMLLHARFLGFSFYFGVRIGRVIDEIRETPAGAAQAWGYSYRTLEGHFERGEIEFQIQKQLATGAISFHISAYSQKDEIRNPFYRWGFKLFGRSLQDRFSRTALARMQKLVGRRLAQRSIEKRTESNPRANPRTGAELGAGKNILQ